MLEHQKKVLRGVSNDLDLFRKELRKSQVWLDSQELNQLFNWVRRQFSQAHSLIIDQVQNDLTSYIELNKKNDLVA